MFVEIITIGDELLIGQVVDTNSAWMGKELNKAGFEITRITSVRDREEEIVEAIETAMKRVDIVLTTGGLGPTKDDITKKILCKYFDTNLIQNEEVLKNIQSLFAKRNISLLKSNMDQAMVPEKATIIMNPVGTAPILWLNKESKVLVSMPGVPQEMKKAMMDEIIPRLSRRFNNGVILHRTYLVKNYPESLLSETLSDWEDQLPESIKLAYLPQLGLIRLRLTIRENNPDIAQNILNIESNKLFDILHQDILREEDTPLNQIIGNILRERHKTLSTAESCTGGSIAAAITAIPGSSGYFTGSIVAYSNDVKVNQLHVKEETLRKHGAVSEETAVEMVRGAMESLNTDYAVATTGIAGPDGGTPEKPVGTVWIAAGSGKKIITRKLESDRGREANILRATNNALILLHDLLLEEQN